MSTLWPWPGVTAWAVENSALSVKKSLPTTGTHVGQVEALVGQDVAADDRRDEDQHDDRGEVAQVLADRHPHGAGLLARRRTG